MTFKIYRDNQSITSSAIKFKSSTQYIQALNKKHLLKQFAENIYIFDGRDTAF